MVILCIHQTIEIAVRFFGLWEIDLRPNALNNYICKTTFTFFQTWVMSFSMQQEGVYVQRFILLNFLSYKITAYFYKLRHRYIINN